MPTTLTPSSTSAPSRRGSSVVVAHAARKSRSSAGSRKASVIGCTPRGVRENGLGGETLLTGRFASVQHTVRPTEGLRPSGCGFDERNPIVRLPFVLSQQLVRL